MATFSDRLRGLRLKKNLKQKQVADALGISESAYGYYEQGRREPSQESLVKLAELLETSVDYLLTGTVKDGIPTEQADFLKWVEDNLQSAFFYDFHKSPEAQKEELIETLRMLWELEQKKQAKRENKDKG